MIDEGIRENAEAIRAMGGDRPEFGMDGPDPVLGPGWGGTISKWKQSPELHDAELAKYKKMKRADALLPSRINYSARAKALKASALDAWDRNYLLKRCTERATGNGGAGGGAAAGAAGAAGGAEGGAEGGVSSVLSRAEMKMVLLEDMRDLGKSVGVRRSKREERSRRGKRQR